VSIPIYWVDAFEEGPFTGNPAAVCILDGWLDDDLMQAIAGENGLSETAFLVPGDDGWHIRWFTPAAEVALCGHATLASAAVIVRYLEPGPETLRFHSRAGELSVRREDGRLVLVFPSRPATPGGPSRRLARALGAEPEAVLSADYHLALFETEEQIRRLRPDFQAVAELGRTGVIVTAPAAADELDFVSRFFAPAVGVDEDPVTGSAHCTLIPYWADRLGRNTLRARQISARGGALYCRSLGDTVEIGGRARHYLRGEIDI
jgi:PhzF family phenazine biosynthesis protein